MTGVIKTDANGVVQTDANGVVQTVSSATAQFDVAIASTTSPVAPGDELGVTATVDNTGGAQGTQTITLDINNGVGQVDSASVTLSAGGSTTQALSWAVPSGQAEQDYTATVASADDSASQTVTVGVGIPNSAIARYVGADFDGNTNTWPDKIGTADLTGTAQEATGINNSDVVRFDGVDDALDTTGFTASYNRWVVAIVFSLSDTSGDEMPFGAASNPNPYFRAKVGSGWQIAYDNGATFGGTVNSNNNIAFVYGPNFSGDDEGEINGTTLITTDVGTRDMVGLTVGDRGAKDFPMQGDVAEVVVYENPTQTDINNERQRLSAEYGITV